MKKVLPNVMALVLAFAFTTVNLIGNTPSIEDNFCFDADVNEAQMDLSIMCLTAPFIMCPSTYLGCPGETNLDPSVTGQAMATPGDPNCPTPTLTYSDVITTNTSCLQVIHRTWDSTYPAGSASIKLHSSCQQTLYLEDSQAPVISNCPGDLSVDLANNCSGIATWNIPTATDDCSLLNFTTTHFSGTAFPSGNTTVTYTAQDGCGFQSTCSFNVNVFGSCCTGPSINCPGNYVACGGGIDPSVTGNAVGSNADPSTCGAVSVSFSDVINSTNACGQSITRTWVASDVSSSVSCIQTINTTDNQIPVISNFPTDMTLTGNGTGCSVPVTWNIPTATDNCGIASFSSDLQSGSTFNQGSTLVTYTAVDNCGNQTTAAFQVTVNCTQPCSAPSIFCPSTFTSCPNSVLPSTSISGIATANAGPGCTGVPTITQSDVVNSSGSCANSQVVLRTFVATDPSTGLSNSCTQTINLIDTTSPFINGMPANMTITGTGAGCTVPVTWTVPTATDNCGVTSFTSNFQPGQTFSAGSTTVVYTAVDACGNSNTLSFTITVNCSVPTCNAPPSINCPATYSACPTTSIPSPSITGNATAVSGGANCGIPSVSYNDIITNSGSCNGSQVISRTWTASDASSGLSSSCLQMINLVDNTAPFFTTNCPTAITLNGTGANCSAAASFTVPAASDNCGLASLVGVANGQVVSSGSTFTQGSTLVTYSATDICGNVSTCAFNVNVNCQSCNTNPTISCPSSNTVCIGTNTSPSTFGTATATSGANCPAPNVTFNDVITGTGSCAGAQHIQRTWTATYPGISSLSASCLQTITLTDVNAPTIVGCPNNLTITSTNAPVSWVAPTATDGCSTPSLTSTHQPGSTFPSGTTTVIYTAVDACGNSSQCSFTVTVNQPQGGFANCPNDITLPCNTSGGAVAQWNTPTYNGACTSCDNGGYIAGFIYMGSFNGSQYYCSLANATWPTAKSIAESHGGFLADVNSASENAFLASQLQAQSAWIGLNDVNSEGTFEWCSNQPLGYTNWFPGQPNNYNGNQDYVEMLNDGTWNDQYNNYSLEFIMEIPCTYITQTSGPTSGTSLQSGAYPVTYTLQDACGAFATCNFTVTVESGLSVTCPADVNVVATTSAGAVCSWNDPVAHSCCSNCNNTGGAIPGFIYMGSLGGSHYYCSQSAATWAQAQQNCVNQGGNLAVVSSAAENTLLSNFLVNNSAWIGASDANSEGNFQWVTGDSFSYSNWYAGQPNNYNNNQDFVEMLNTGEWNDQYGTVPLEYILEISNCINIQQTGGPVSGTVCTPGTHTVSYTIQDGCGNVETCSFEVTVTVPNTGGGNGNPGAYCTSGGGSSSNNYIHSFGFSTISNKSGNNGGYANYTNMCTSVHAGNVYPLQLTPGFGGASAQKVYWTCWIDYNMDGDFNDNYEFVAYGCGTKTLSGSVTIPYAVWNGTTRMRCTMKVGGYATDPCATYLYGETEDYCVTITGADLKGQDDITLRTNGSNQAIELTTIGDEPSITIYPNPVSNYMTLELNDGDNVEALELIDIQGKLVRSIESTQRRVNVTDLEGGIYMLKATYTDGSIITERVIVQH